MRLLGWWKNKEQKTAHVPQLAGPAAQVLPIPATAREGDMFRTVGFIKPETGPDFMTWREAVEHPLISGNWLVQDVWRVPNTKSSAPPFVNDRSNLKGREGTSFEEALRILGRYELTQEPLGFLPYGPSAEELGEEHITAFARRNGIIFDQNGNPHMTHNGRNIDEGCFSPAEEAAVREAVQLRAKEGRPPWREATPLSRFFKNAARADIPDSFFDLNQSYLRWLRFVDKVHETVGWLLVLQNQGFKPKLRGVHSFDGYVYIKMGREYESSLANAKSMIANLTHVSASDKAEIYEPFLRDLDLVYEVAYARHLFIKQNREKDVSANGRVQKQIDKAANVFRKMGASDQDVANLKMEIINGSGQVSLGRVWEGPVKLMQRVMNAHISEKYKVNVFLDLDDVYYCPDAICDFLEKLHQTSAEFKQRIEDEKAKATLAALPDPAASPSLEKGPQ